MCSPSFLKPIQKDPLIKAHVKTDPIQKKGLDPVGQAIMQAGKTPAGIQTLGPNQQSSKEEETNLRTFGLSGNPTQSTIRR